MRLLYSKIILMIDPQAKQSSCLLQHAEENAINLEQLTTKRLTPHQMLPGQAFVKYPRTGEFSVQASNYPDHICISEDFCRALQQIATSLGYSETFAQYSFMRIQGFKVAEDHWNFGFVNDSQQQIVFDKGVLAYLRYGGHADDAEGEALANLHLAQIMLTSKNAEMHSIALAYLEAFSEELLAKYTKAIESYERSMLHSTNQKRELQVMLLTNSPELNDPEMNELLVRQKIKEMKANKSNKQAGLIVGEELGIPGYALGHTVHFEDLKQRTFDALRSIRKDLHSYFLEDFESWLVSNLKEQLRDQFVSFQVRLRKELDQIEKQEAIDDHWFYADDLGGLAPYQKQSAILKYFSELLSNYGFESDKISSLKQQLRSDYDSFGTHVAVGTIIPNSHSNPHNAQYNALLVFNNDGSRKAVIEKESVITEEDFDERKRFAPKRVRDKHYVLAIGGHKVGFLICDDIWRDVEGLVGRLSEEQSGLLIDPLLAEAWPTNWAADIVFSPSASPERNADMVPLDLEEIKQLSGDVYYIGGRLLRPATPRSEVRKTGLVVPLAVHYQTLFGYNSAGGAGNTANVFFGGSIVCDRKGHYVESEPYQPATMAFNISCDSQLEVHTKRSKTLSAPYNAISELSHNIAYSVAGLLFSRRIEHITLAYDSSLYTKLLLNRLPHIRQLIARYHMRRNLLLQATQNISAESTIYAATKATQHKGLRVTTYYIPSLKTIFSTQLLKDTYQLVKLLAKGSTNVRAAYAYSVITLIFVEIAAQLHLPILSTWLIEWAAAPFDFMLLGIALLYWGISRDVFDKALNFVGLGSRTTLSEQELRDAITSEMGNMRFLETGFDRTNRLAQNFDAGLERMSKMGRFGDAHSEGSLRFSLLDWGSEFRQLLNDYFSIFVNAIISLDRTRFETLYHQNSLHINPLNGEQAELGLFPVGGIESAGFSPMATSTSNILKALSIADREQALGQSIRFLANVPTLGLIHRGLDYLIARLEWRAHLLEVKEVALSGVPWSKRLVSTIPFVYYRGWGIANRPAALSLNIQRLSIALANTQDPLRKHFLSGIIAKLKQRLAKGDEEAKLNLPSQKPLNFTRLRRLRRKGLRDEVLISMLLENHKILDNTATLAMAKPYFAPHYSDEEYAGVCATVRSRRKHSLHKREMIVSQNLSAKRSGALDDPATHQLEDPLYFRTEIIKEIKAFRKIQLDLNQVSEKIVASRKVLVIPEGRDDVLQREGEKRLLELEIASAKDSDPHALIILQGLADSTDHYAFELATKYELPILALTTSDSLRGFAGKKLWSYQLLQADGDLKTRVPGGRYHVFSSSAKKDNFLAEIGAMTTVKLLSYDNNRPELF